MPSLVNDLTQRTPIVLSKLSSVSSTRLFSALFTTVPVLTPVVSNYDASSPGIFSLDAPCMQNILVDLFDLFKLKVANFYLKCL